MNIEDISKTKKTTFSLEVFPPKKDSAIDTIYKTLNGIGNIPSDFISVTYGAGGSAVQKNKTCEIASLIKEKYNIEPLAHLTCITSTKQDITDALDLLKKSAVMNILALRGDENPLVPRVFDFVHASDLTAFIMNYDSNFNIVGACYPECHGECESIDKDIENLKIKLNAGVSHLITQLFFDNSSFFAFIEKLRKQRISVPVDAGIMPITTVSQITRTVSMCGASIPKKLSHIFSKYQDVPDDLRKAGTEFAIEQISELIDNGVDGIHLYTMNSVSLAENIYEGIKSRLIRANK